METGKNKNVEKKILDSLKEDFKALTNEQEETLSGGFASIANTSCPPLNTQCGNTVAGCHGPVNTTA